MALFLAGLAFGRPGPGQGGADRRGGGVFRIYRRVVLPAISPIFLAAAIVMLQFAIKTFDLAAALTGGGPGIATTFPAIYVYDLMFQRGQIGKGRRRHHDAAGAGGGARPLFRSGWSWRRRHGERPPHPHCHSRAERSGDPRIQRKRSLGPRLSLRSAEDDVRGGGPMASVTAAGAVRIPWRPAAVKIGVYVVLALFAAYYLLPLFVVVLNSFREMPEIAENGLIAWPQSFGFDGWVDAWSTYCIGGTCEGMKRNFYNSLAMTIPATIISTAIGAVNGCR